jgi:two-component system cell cycle sensor histidine kinase/response regulator CckA
LTAGRQARDDGAPAKEDSERRDFFDVMPELGWTALPDGSVDFYNRGWYAYTGKTFEQLRGWGWKSLHDVELLPAVLACWQDALRTGLAFEMEFPLRRHDGTMRWFLNRAVPVRDLAGVIVRWVGVSTDIDEQRARLITDLDQFFAMSLDFLCIAGIDGFFKRLNPCWSKVLGWRDEELLSRPWLDFVHPDDREATVEAGGQLSSGAAVIAFTNRYSCKDGTYRWFEWRAVPALTQQLIYAAARDITDRREAESRHAELQRRLIIADRMVSVGTLAAGVAHEINNPLSYVVSNLEMVLEEIRALAGGSASGRLKELEEMVLDAREGADRVRKIVRGLKTFSRVNEEQLAIIDVRPTIEVAVNMAFNEVRHRARLVKDFGPTPLVEADDARLGQVFLNLLVNAAQAIPEGKTALNEIRVTTSTDAAGRAIIEVRDTGPRIAPDVAARIFEPFFTTKDIGVGTGLGLSICHNIVGGMGGEITVHSVVGTGTTFRVALPAATVQHPSQEAHVSGRASTEARVATVLVVDDEPSVGLALQRVLKEHDVTVVTSVRAALDLLASGKHFDVIFSDLMMPHMTGVDFYEELARRSASDAGRIVFVTGGAFTPLASAFLDRVANERIEKPFSPQAVRALVLRFLK